MPAALYGPWDYSERDARFPYDDTVTYNLAGEYLSGNGIVEDWGCGGGWARKFIKDRKYRGIDGAPAPWVDEVVDLRTYRSEVPCALMRHVLEHNPEWRKILESFCASFQRRAVIVTFVPFSDGDDVYLSDETWPVPDISLSRQDFETIIRASGAEFRGEHVATTAQRGAEDIFYLTKE